MEPRPTAVWESLSPGTHVAQFYEDDAALVDGVSEFAGAALGSGGAAVVVATPAHRDALASRFGELGLDVERAARQGRYVARDAAETLALVLDGEKPDPARFARIIGPIIDRAAGATRGHQPRVAVFGEMVALLAVVGNTTGALHLEEIWNELVRARPFSLLCGYPISVFDRSRESVALDRICVAHDRVLPGESYAALSDDDARAREIVRLQQQARALEKELLEHQRVAEALRERSSELQEARDEIAAVAVENARLYRDAQEALKARDEFLSIAAHELKTPVTVIKTTIQTLERTRDRGDLDDRRLDRYVRSILHGADRLANLSSQLLDVTRIQAGHLALDLAPLDLRDLVRQQVDAYRDHLDPRYTIELDCPNEACPILADAIHFEQVLVNLLDNAVAFSPEGGPIRVAVAAEGAAVTLRVSDTGIGIPTLSLEDVFQPFTRAPNAARAHLSHLGLGLYICRSIVERHGGTIRAESPGLGLGTTIAITVPDEVR